MEGQLEEFVLALLAVGRFVGAIQASNVTVPGVRLVTQDNAQRVLMVKTRGSLVTVWI